MKNLKNNRWFASITMILFVFGVFFIVKAVENKGETTTLAPMTVYFQPQSNDTEDIQEISNWESEPGDLDCDGRRYLCEVTFDTNTYADLNAFLGANPDKASIEENALAVSHKN